ncbi:MAG: hypothetical protein ACUVV5_07135 [Candidatus Aminicenantales bacterium]
MGREPISCLSRPRGFHFLLRFCIKPDFEFNSLGTLPRALLVLEKMEV